MLRLKKLLGLFRPVGKAALDSLFSIASLLLGVVSESSSLTFVLQWVRSPEPTHDVVLSTKHDPLSGEVAPNAAHV